MKNKFFASIILSCFAATLPGQDAVSNADLARKLDLILLKVDSLEKRVNTIEGKKDPRPVVTTPARSIATQPRVSPPQQLPPTPPAAVIPQDPKEKKSFFQKLKQELRSDEALAAGPWTNPDTWSQIRKNISSFEVRRILGNPTKIKNSINPRIERVYRYEGDLDGDGVKEKGIVNFHRDRVVSFETPSQVK